MKISHHRKVVEFYSRFHGGEHVRAPPPPPPSTKQTSENFRDLVESYLRPLWTYHL